MSGGAVLVVLRGNSGSGKSTVARLVQEEFERGACLVVPQDRVRRNMLRERVSGPAHVELLEAIATWGLARGLVVVVEGILNAATYEPMLERLAEDASDAWFFAWDLGFEETVRRHAQRPQRDEFTPEEMAAWYQGWDPLDFVQETRFDRLTSTREAVETVLSSIAGSCAGRGATGWSASVIPRATP